jgi:cation transport ATPase
MQHEAHAEHAEHADHTAHAHHHEAHQSHAHHAPAATWSMAAQATLHCLTGCAIGEVLGMIIGTAFGWGNLPTMILAIVLAFFFGYSLTLRGVLKAGVDFRTAFKVALAADTLSIAVMELIDNGVILVWPSAMDATLGDALFWISLAISLVIAFVVTTPVNKWTIGRGKGHAVVHRYHH